ncbi:hypothetical protein SAMN04489740_0884 [Arthrobacter alpinus]|uniref:HTH cro/C1-type domain-containing protein n=1 Tax=Arthrobacter alpinus TaxID=656366 RepID=A0A1H5GYN8_9MICC|nr:hypothetical protein [Arthrobacter alpinus]SEE20826.1 hypothetical protein SAMN04489740_0884 [Arthrobacter alpinus]
MNIATTDQPRIFSPKHPVSVAVVEAIKNCMDVRKVSKADIVANSHLTSRTLDKKLKHKSPLMVSDIFAFARILGVCPSVLFAAADNQT